jgi:hypothetical protein
MMNEKMYIVRVTWRLAETFFYFVIFDVRAELIDVNNSFIKTLCHSWGDEEYRHYCSNKTPM